MKAMILAAGLGTRLRPWTLSHPKALVPVGGTPMLERVILNLKRSGFSKIVVNVHHFASQIVDFLEANDFGVDIAVSDESDLLLDTGGAILHAAPLLCADDAPFLVHNVDILSNADLGRLMEAHVSSGRGSTLLVSRRESSRRLVFDPDMRLRGWHSAASDEFRPEEFVMREDYSEFPFSGIHVMSPVMVERMRARGLRGAFPIMDFFLSEAPDNSIGGYLDDNLRLIDIGKPATLARADSLFDL